MSKYQPRGSPLCGPTALRNALYVLGKRVSIQRCIDYCALDNYADQFALMRGIHEFQYVYSEFQTNERNQALRWVLDGICLLCIDDWSHWITTYHVHNARWQLVDSENSKKNKAENGNQIVPWSTLSKRWAAAARLQTDPTDATYYGIKLWRA